MELLKAQFIILKNIFSRTLEYVHDFIVLLAFELSIPKERLWDAAKDAIALNSDLQQLKMSFWAC